MVLEESFCQSENTTGFCGARCEREPGILPERDFGESHAALIPISLWIAKLDFPTRRSACSHGQTRSAVVPSQFPQFHIRKRMACLECGSQSDGLFRVRNSLSEG
uniref:Uncharacterized protein n=1 Tax=Caenorhabditis japonica TaxID=281687 RepID=A0A8R1EU91_CAEJA